MPKISVIIPAYNQGNFICEAIDSVLNQTIKDAEVIVVDDGSTDNTKKTLERYNGKISYLYQKNSGVSSARNRGIRESKGKYIAFLDADDTWLPEKLEKALKFLEQGKFDWICTSRFKLTDDGKKTERKIEPESGIYDDKGRMNRLEIGLFNPNYILAITSTVVIKKKCIDVCGFFDDTLRICEDLDLLLRFKEAGLTGGYLDEPLIVKRSYATSLSKNNTMESLEYTIKVAKKHARILKLDKFLTGRLYGEFWWETALSYYLNGSKWNAVKYSLVSFYFYPSLIRLFKMFRHSLNSKRGG